MSSPSLRSLAAVFLRHGNMTFGGGSATIATLHGKIVTKRDWVTQRLFDLSYALSRLTPGTNLLAFSTAIGWLVNGWSGALVVLLAASIPCSVLAVLLTAVYRSWSSHPFAVVALRGALAAAIGIVAATAWTLIRPHVKDASKLKIAAFALGAFLLAAVFHVPPIRVLVLAAVIGVVLPRSLRCDGLLEAVIPQKYLVAEFDEWSTSADPGHRFTGIRGAPRANYFVWAFALPGATESRF